MQIREWGLNWNRYTKRRFDAGLPIIQRILKERQSSTGTLAQRSTESLSKLIDEVRRETYPARPSQASTDSQAGSSKNFAAEGPETGGEKTAIKGSDSSRQTTSKNPFHRALGAIARAWRAVRPNKNRGRG